MAAAGRVAGAGGSGDAFCTVAAQVVAGLWSERQARCVGAADGQQPTAGGISTTLGEPWRIVGRLGR
jgi:hypothetical protein